MTDKPSSKATRKPRAVVLDSGNNGNNNNGDSSSGKTKAGEQQKPPRKPKASTSLNSVVEIPDEIANGLNEELTPPPLDAETVQKRFSWSSLLFAALGGLFSLGVGLWIDQLLQELFARSDWLGWIALCFTLLFVLAVCAILIREIIGLVKMRKINKLRQHIEEAHHGANLKTARKLVLELDELCEKLPRTANGRESLKEHANAVMDPSDLLVLAEHSLMLPLDKRAKTLILDSAKRVSIVTAVSPRAVVDIIYVLMENFRLIRALSELYGGRPGTYGLLRLARMIITHLAATGAIALGDGIMQQFIGHGLASKLSRRLGEGVINGLLTARIGISSMDICRPMPFHGETRPGVSDFLQELARLPTWSGDAQK